MCHDHDASQRQEASPSGPHSLHTADKFELRPEQWAEVNDYATVHRAWLRFCQSEQGELGGQPKQQGWESAVFRSLTHATRYGIEDAPDRDLFAFHAIQMTANFHENKKMEPVWEMVRAGHFYGGACEIASALPADRLHDYLHAA